MAEAPKEETTVSCACQEISKYRIVLLGPAGAGKSALGNTLLGDKRFLSKGGVNPITNQCSMESGHMETADGTVHVIVWDTPGLCDSKRKDAQTKELITRCLGSLTPGPHVILLVVNAQNRFLNNEYALYQSIKKLIGPQLLQHMIVVFTRGDVFEKENTNLEDLLRQNEFLPKMLADVKNRHIVIDNDVIARADAGKNRKQLAKLWELMKSVTPDQRFCSGEIFERMEKLVAEEVRKRLEKRPKKTDADIRQEVVRELINSGKMPEMYQQLFIIFVDMDKKSKSACPIL